MREIIPLPRHLDGRTWLYRNKNFDHPMHRHSELEVNLVVRGTARYVLGDQRFDLRPGMQMWLFPAQEHVLVDRSSDYEMWIGVFRVGLVRRACTSPETMLLRKADPKGVICRQLSREQSTRLASLHAEVSAKELDDPATINAGFAWLLLASWAAFRAASMPAAGEDVHPAVEKAARILRDEDQALSLDELAERCELSPHRLSRIFKKQTGLPLVRYRQRQMLQRFLAAMQSGRPTNMLEAALDAGFGSYPQFHRVFKQIIGISPRGYFRGRRLGEDSLP